MATTNTWDQVVQKITGVANRGTLNWSGSNTTYGVASGYYTGGTLDSRPSYTNGYNTGVSAADNRVNTSSASYSSGYNNGYNAGNSAGYNNGYNAGVNAGRNTYGMKSASGNVTWANPGTKTLTVSFTPIFFISYGTTSSGNIGIFAALKNFHQIMNWGTTVIRDNSGSQTNQIVFNSNSVSVTTENSAFRGRTMTYHIYGS